MKHIYLFLFAFTIVPFCYTQNIDSSYTYSWNGSSWAFNGRGIYSYNDACQLVSQLNQAFNVNESTWINSSLYHVSYSPLKQTGELSFWDAASNTFNSIARNTITFTAESKTSQVLSEYWSSARWDTVSRSKYEYNVDGKTSKITTEEYDSIWREKSYSLYTYNSDGSEEYVSGFVLDNATQLWVPGSRITTVHNTSLGQIEITIESWQTDHWVKSYHDVQEYNTDNKLIRQLQQFGDAQSNIWVNFGLSTFSYNADGTRSEVVTQLWQANSQTWKNSNRTTYVYKPGCTLPLTLLSFDGIKQGGKINLSWVVTNQYNTAYFNVQRSFDGVRFTNIGLLKAETQSRLMHNYKFVDDDLAGVNNKRFYRLQIVDNDNSSRFSNIINLQVSSGNLISVLPNPVTNLLKVKVGIPSSFAIYNVTGIIQLSGKVQDGTNDINVSALPKGVYVLKLTDIQGSVYAQKIVVQ